jgi:hypothetical protein
VTAEHGPTHTCPMCDGTPMLLGAFGSIVHLNCRFCGWVYSVRAADIDLTDDLTDFDPMEVPL